MKTTGMVLFSDIPAHNFRPFISFANEAERRYLLERLCARAVESSEPGFQLHGIEIRISPFIPRGVAVLNQPGQPPIIFTFDQGFDANGSPA